MWPSIAGYFSDLLRIPAAYGIITLIILKELIDNQKTVCLVRNDTLFQIDRKGDTDNSVHSDVNNVYCLILR